MLGDLCNIPASMKASPTWTAESDLWWSKVYRCTLPGQAPAGPVTVGSGAPVQSDACNLGRAAAGGDPGGVQFQAYFGTPARVQAFTQQCGPISLPSQIPPPAISIAPGPTGPPITPIDLTLTDRPPTPAPSPSPIVPLPPVIQSVSLPSSAPGYILPALPNTPGLPILGGPTTEPGLWSASGVPYAPPAPASSDKPLPTWLIVAAIGGGVYLLTRKKRR